MKKLLLACLLGSVCVGANATPSYMEYGDIPCKPLADIAGEMMMDWQKNASIKDMLSNSAAYGEKLHKSSSLSLNDAEQHTYVMAQAAQKETVRSSPFYKTHAASKFSVDYNFVCELKNTSVSMDYIDQHNECRDEERYASGFMDSRQVGVSLDELLRINQDAYDQRLITHSNENTRSSSIYESTNRIILDAYSRPLEGSVFMKEKSAIDFGQEYFIQCISK